MYHSHMDDVRQQPAGLVGAMIVSDDPTADPPDDHQVFLKGARDGQIGNNPLEIGGRGPADTIVLHAGRPARFRFMSLSALNANATITLTARPDSSFRNLADTMVVRWTPIAKDGYDLPAPGRMLRAARQAISMGETYDFEFTPKRRGEQLRIEIRGAAATQALLARVPVRVE
jgi:FtsP/CotA-like multicopper oxidase with cupredoxin domain